MRGSDAKIEWQGEIRSVQPRIRLNRSFDERSHIYLGTVLRIRGTLDGEAGEFIVATGGWPSGRSRRSARRASGAARWRSR